MYLCRITSFRTLCEVSKERWNRIVEGIIHCEMLMSLNGPGMHVIKYFVLCLGPRFDVMFVFNDEI